MITVYGLKNCDTCRKALKWLEAEGLAHTFHDVRKDGLEAAHVDAWIKAAGTDALLNRRGTTWRKLSDAEKEAAETDGGRQVMLAHPATIKRPVFVTGGGEVIVGFKAEQQERLGAGEG